MLFSKWKSINDEQINKAITLACLTQPEKYLGARYILYKGKLIIALNISYGNELPTTGKFKQVLFNNLPKKYNSKIEFWKMDEYCSKLPNNVNDKYVSLRF